MNYRYYNPNPLGRNVGDCSVRALSKALGKDWEDTFIALCLHGLLMRDMPSANVVWGDYLKQNGFSRRLAPDDCTVKAFADAHPNGLYVLAMSGHVVCIQDGTLYDSWDSSNELVIYFWNKEETE